MAFNGVIFDLVAGCPVATPTPTPTNTPTPTPTPTDTPTPTPATYDISYSLSGTAPNKDLTIDVNSVNVVNCPSGCFGNITVAPGDSVYVSTNCSTSPPLLASLDWQVVDNGTQIYANVVSGNAFASDSYTYTVSGDGSIIVFADEY